MITDNKTLILKDDKPKKGYTSIPNIVLTAKGLSIGAKMVYGLLLMHAWQKKECFPGQERLAADTGISVRQVQRYLCELRGYGLITWKQRGQNQSNIYYIKDIKSVERLKIPDTTNMSHPDTTCTSYEEDSVKRSVVVGEPKEEIISNNDEIASSTVNDGAAFDLPAPSVHEQSEQEAEGGGEYEPNQADEPVWEKIRVNVHSIAGVNISGSFAKEIVRDYEPAQINSALSELQRQLAQGVKILKLGGWLRYALRNNIQPDQPAVARTLPKSRDCNNIRTPGARPKGLPETSYTMTAEQELKKKELIRSLYV